MLKLQTQEFPRPGQRADSPGELLDPAQKVVEAYPQRAELLLGSRGAQSPARDLPWEHPALGRLHGGGGNRGIAWGLLFSWGQGVQRCV